MRTSALLGAAALALACGPAMAQSDSNNDQLNTQGTQQQAANQTGQQSSQQQGSDQMQAMTQQKLRSDLEKAGFTNVTVLDAAYLVQAQSSDGNRVMMFINPPSMGGSGAGSSGSSSGGSSSGSSSTTSGG